MNQAGTERRRHERFDIERRVRAIGEDGVYEGTLKDVSAGGAAVLVGKTLAEAAEVELEIEDVGRFAGRVMRLDDDLTSVAFDLDEGEQDELIAGIMQIQSGISRDDDFDY